MVTSLALRLDAPAWQTFRWPRTSFEALTDDQQKTQIAEKTYCFRDLSENLKSAQEHIRLLDERQRATHHEVVKLQVLITELVRKLSPSG